MMNSHIKNIFLKIIPGFLGLLVLLGSCKTQNISDDKREITVNILSYNVRNCRGMDDVTDYQRVAGVINKYAPDVAAIQELDSATQRSLGVVVLDTLAALTGMYQTYSASIDFQGGKYGIGILSKEKPLSRKVFALPGKEEKRSMLMVELPSYYICCTHFSLTAEDRVTSAEIINQAVKNLRKPVFIAGDFNAIRGSSEIARIERDWFMLNDAAIPTIPAGNPNKCIDFIFGNRLTNNTFEVIRTSVGAEPVASDHLPVFTEVIIR